MEEDLVIYVQCPHCKKGWYGKFIRTNSHWEGNKHIMDEFIIQGINPTNLTEPIHCLNCHKYYTPLEKELISEILDGYGEAECIVFKDGGFKKMPDFVAYMLTTCQGS